MTLIRQRSVSLMTGWLHHTRLIGDEKKAGKTDEAIVGFSRCYKLTLATPSTPIKTQSQYDQKFFSMSNANYCILRSSQLL